MQWGLAYLLCDALSRQTCLHITPLCHGAHMAMR